MEQHNMKEKIIQESVKFFGDKGFHGTTMRDIANASGCSLPTLYYYFKNKQDLFEEIIIKEFLKIIDNLNKQIDFTKEPEELYFQVIKTRKELSPHDKEVYKLAIKVWLGFEGNGKARDKVMEWENNRITANRRILDKYISNESIHDDFAVILVNFLESIINKIILLDEDVDDEKLKRRLGLLFKLAKL